MDGKDINLWPLSAGKQEDILPETLEQVFVAPASADIELKQPFFPSSDIGEDVILTPPNVVNFRSQLEGSTFLTPYDVNYRVIQIENASSENASYDVFNITADPPEMMPRNEALARIEIAVLATIFALAVVGNVCVLVALGRRRKITSRMHMFILHLSVADLLVAFCNILPQLAWDITGSFLGGDFLCRLVTFLQVFVMYLSTYVLVMTAVDRYRAICYPLSNYSWTTRTVNLMIAGVYLLSALLSIPQPLLFKYQVANDAGDYDCWADFDPPWMLKAYILTFTVLVYLIPFCILVFTYGSICFTIWSNETVAGSSHHQQNDVNNLSSTASANGKPGGGGGGGGGGSLTPSSSSTPIKHANTSFVTSTPAVTTPTATSRLWTGSRLLQQPQQQQQQQHQQQQQQRQSSRRHHHTPSSSPRWFGGRGVMRPRAHSVRGFSRAKLKTVKLTFVVIVAYLLCWSPFFVSQLWWLYDPAQEANSAVVIMVLLSSLNSCCNPWIYLAFSGNLLRHLFPCCLWPCCPPPAGPLRPAFVLNTPTHTPQHRGGALGLEMLVFKGGVKTPAGGGHLNHHHHHHHHPHCPSSSALQATGTAARHRDLCGCHQGCHSPAQKRAALRQLGGSSSSLVTTRLSRNNASGPVRQRSLQKQHHELQNHHQQQKQQCQQHRQLQNCPSGGMSPVALTHTPEGDTLLFFERNGQACGALGSSSSSSSSSKTGGGSGGRKRSKSKSKSPLGSLSSSSSSTKSGGGGGGGGGGGVRKGGRVPLALILQACDEDAPPAGSTTSGGRESSSGSTPRSPHLFKRTRLHERPAEEVAEAQLKWEHNMGIRGPSIS